MKDLFLFLSLLLFFAATVTTGVQAAEKSLSAIRHAYPANTPKAGSRL